MENIESTPLYKRTKELTIDILSIEKLLGFCLARWLWGRYLHGKLGHTLYLRFKTVGTVEDLGDAETHYRKVLDFHPVGHHDRATALNDLAVILQTRTRHLGNAKDLEAAVEFHLEALSLRPSGHPDRAGSLKNLGLALETRFEQCGRVQDLEQAIAYHTEASSIRGPGHPDCPSVLHSLGQALKARFDQLGEKKDLEQALVFHHEALSLCAVGHPDRSMVLSSLGNTLNAQFDQLSNVKDLTDAVVYFSEALHLCPLGHPEHASYLNNLAECLDAQFSHFGRAEDLDQAITHYNQACALLPVAHPHFPMALGNLGNALMTRFGNLGKTEDLEKALAYHYKAHELILPGNCAFSTSLTNLANSVRTYFQISGKVEALEEAIQYYHQALESCPSGNSSHLMSLSNLGLALDMHFQQLGKIEDLEEAVACQRNALSYCTSVHKNYAMFLNNLGNSLQTRFEQLQTGEDLVAVIDCHHQALALRPPGHANRAISLNNLANALQTRFDKSGLIKDLDEAIIYYDQALALRPHGHIRRSTSLNNLAFALQARFKRLGKAEDLEHAIAYTEEALELCPHGHPDRPFSLYYLAISFLHYHFQDTNEIQHLQAATSYLNEAKSALPIDHPFGAQVNLSLGILKVLEHDYLCSSKDRCTCLDEAFTLFENAWNHSSASSTTRLLAAQKWSFIASKYGHHTALCAYSKALLLQQQHLLFLPSIESQQTFLATSSSHQKSLALNAAACAIDSGNLETAVEFLEQGRAILWAKMQGYRHSIEDLTKEHPLLAQQFRDLSQQLEHLAMTSETHAGSKFQSGPNSVFSVNYDEKMKLQHQLSKDYDQVLARIRATNGFTDFLKAVPFKTLQTVAVSGPVIIAYISDFHSGAIILFATSSPVFVPLPDATPATLAQLVAKLGEATDNIEEPSKKIVPILQKIWDIVVFPVKNCLEEMQVPEKSHIWWCPTSYLCSLPIHAAGPFKRGQKGLSDLYISSYTPTLSSLIKAQANISDMHITPKVLLMGQPDGTIPRVSEEIASIQQVGPFVSTLTAEKAHKKAVLSALQDHSWAHFASHGHLNEQPFHSWFQLHNMEHLTVLDLAQAQLQNAELAFLSACHSAAGDIYGTPDEVIHLAAAIQFSGFRSVVGTLWAMVDDDGPVVAEIFYKHMFRNPNHVDFRDAAEALNLATKHLRRNGVSVDRWINFVHIGA